MVKNNVYAIVITYNGLKWIDKCLKSLFESSKIVEVIVVDNASEDGTADYIRTNYRNVILLQQETNLGFGMANNIGLSYAIQKEAEYVFLLNQDASVEENTIENLVNVSYRSRDFGILSPLHLNGTGNKLDESFLYYIKDKSCDEYLSKSVLNQIEDKVYDIEMINAAAWLLPIHAVRKVGGFSPLFFLYGEDDNYCQRMRYHGFKIGIYPHAVVYHDSNNSYKQGFKKGSTEYYNKFTNRVKVKYADINKDYSKELEQLRKYFLKEAVLYLFKLDIKDFKVNLKKGKLISQLNFHANLKKERKGHGPYLNLE